MYLNKVWGFGMNDCKTIKQTICNIEIITSKAIFVSEKGENSCQENVKVAMIFYFIAAPDIFDCLWFNRLSTGNKLMSLQTV